MTHDVLAGRTAVVTGASRGIGAAIAAALAARGVRVALLARNVERLSAMTASLGAGATAYPCDLADPAQVAAVAQSIAHAWAAGPDILINNAGLFQLARLDLTEPSAFHDAIATNLTAPFLLIRAMVPLMRARGSGHIVNIGSIADRVVMPENGAYSAAKYGLRAMHEVLRLETRGTGVRTTLVSPSATDTPLWDPVLAEPGERMLPTRETMLPAAAVADAVVYALAQPAAVNVDELRLSRS